MPQKSTTESKIAETGRSARSNLAGKTGRTVLGRRARSEERDVGVSENMSQAKQTNSLRARGPRIILRTSKSFFFTSPLQVHVGSSDGDAMAMHVKLSDLIHQDACAASLQIKLRWRQPLSCTWKMCTGQCRSKKWGFAWFLIALGLTGFGEIAATSISASWGTQDEYISIIYPTPGQCFLSAENVVVVMSLSPHVYERWPEYKDAGTCCPT
jgi:hypothetical protein